MRKEWISYVLKVPLRDVVDLKSRVSQVEKGEHHHQTSLFTPKTAVYGTGHQINTSNERQDELYRKIHNSGVVIVNLVERTHS